jgi:hypothetical protein
MATSAHNESDRFGFARIDSQDPWWELPFALFFAEFAHLLFSPPRHVKKENGPAHFWEGPF